MSRPLRALLLLSATAALVSVASASPENNDQVINDPFKDVDADLVLVLSPDELRAQILGTSDLWSLFVFKSDVCDANCEMQSAAFIEAAKLGGSVGRFGVLDVLDEDEIEMATKELGVNAIPTVRVFNKPSVLNKYTNKLWRASVPFNGQFTARSIRKGIEKAMPADAIKKIASMAEHDVIVAEARAANLALVLLISTKERIAPLTSSLSMSVHNRAIVAQVQPGDGTTDVLAKYAIEKAPALVVLPVVKNEEASTFETFSDSLSGKTVRDLAAFVLERSPEAVKPAAAVGSQGKGGNKKDGTPKKKSVSLRAEAKTLIHKAKETSLPAVVAYRIGNEEAAPSKPDEKWDAFEERLSSYGMTVGTVLCSDLQAELPSEDGEEEEMPAECAKLLKEWGSGFHMAVYSFTQRTPADLKDDLVDTIKEITWLKSLSDLKATAVDSIPERVTIVSADTMSEWMATVVQMKQGIPTILVGKQSDPPVMFKALAASLAGISSFAYVQDKTGDALKGLGAPPQATVPTLLAFMPSKGQDGLQEQQMLLAMYDRNRLGKFTYASMTSFVLGMGNEGNAEATTLWLRSFGAHANVYPFGYKFPDEEQQGSNEASSSSKPSSSSSKLQVFTEEALTPATWESSCASHASNIICIVGFLDGDVANTELIAQVQTLKDAADTSEKRPSQAAQFVFMWADATCHKSFAEGLDVDVAILPSVVAYHPGKKLARKHVLGYTEASVLGFLEGIKSNQGRGFSPVKVSPTLDSSIDCATVDGRDMRGSEAEDLDNDDMAEMLKEIQEEEKKQKKLEKKEAKLRVAEAKKEEADRVAKAKVEAEKARAGKQTRRRRRRRRRRKGASKDEL